MPEGPELHMASQFVNRVCGGVVFSGAVEKSEVSKNPEVPFACAAYRISAISRGKEVRLTLTPIKDEGAEGGGGKPMDIVFRFGMSGFFRYTAQDELPKHAHLRFYTKEKPRKVLSFVDIRRFGSWEPNGTWQAERGPCVMFEYQSFRDNVLSNLSDRAFDKPICEALLNQKYFNGIGNYLRAEILYRLKIPPFVKARTVLEGLLPRDYAELDVKPVKTGCASPQSSEISLSKKVKLKKESPDLLNLCHTVPLEVIQIGGKGYDPEKADYSDFEAWLQCYYVSGMKSLRDHNGRTMWFQGDPGPMAPKASKSPKAKKRAKKTGDGENNAQVVQEKELAKKVKEEKESKRKQRMKKGKGVQSDRGTPSPVPKRKMSQSRKTPTAGQAVSKKRSRKSSRASAKQTS